MVIEEDEDGIMGAVKKDWVCEVLRRGQSLHLVPHPKPHPHPQIQNNRVDEGLFTVISSWSNYREKDMNKRDDRSDGHETDSMLELIGAKWIDDETDEGPSGIIRSGSKSQESVEEEALDDDELCILRGLEESSVPEQEGLPGL
ncbi:hypothetical protein BY996DRAFT_6615828 [Phakopsora pachyrhizi]|nr:hypothetical protein BY996DRAFT_6615828 [Phakopsora pachyrhizi]